MHVSRDTVDRIFRSESPHVRRRGMETSVTIICTVEEGAACRFGSGDWDDPVLDPLLPKLIEDLGWKAIEHSARREVVIRCVAAGGDPANAICEADAGEGFEPLPIIGAPAVEE